MNSLDDPLDEQLRRQFQQVFDAYEVTPPASLKDRIWRELPKATFRRYVACSLVLVGTLFPAGGRLFEQPSPDRLNRQASGQVNMGTGHQADNPVATTTGRYVAATATSSDAPQTSPTTPATGQRNKLLSDPPVQRLVIPATDLSVAEVTRATTAGTSEVRTKAMADRQDAIDAGPQPDENTTAASPNALVKIQESSLANEVGKLPLPDQDMVSDQQSPNAAEETNLLSIAVSQLSIHRLLVGGLSWPITRTVDFARADVSPEVRVTPHRVVPDWFVRVAALSTYQQMTVVAKAGVHVQHVGSPSALSGQTWGYQISGGISWHRWDAYVSYGQIRRWAYYDLATEDFEVKSTSSTDYQITRRVETRAENVALPLLGVGVSKQYSLGRRQQYYARVGGQVTYVPATRQALGWAQASWGLNLPLGQAHLVQVGPVVEYSLNRIWSAERQLIIHPYTVGVSVTVRPHTFLAR